MMDESWGMGSHFFRSEGTQRSHRVGERSPLPPWTEPNSLGSFFLDKTPFCQIRCLENDTETHLSINVYKQENNNSDLTGLEESVNLPKTLSDDNEYSVESGFSHLVA